MRFLSLILLVLITSCSQKVYIVRHGEKAVPNADGSSGFMAGDPPLSEAGKARAELLKKKLSGNKMGHIFSTKYQRNIQTAEPLALSEKIKIELYNPRPDSVESFLSRVKSIKKKNVLIVGHSNTVDDLVNHFADVKYLDGDLPETEYDNLFIFTRKGSSWKFKREKFGDPAGADKK
jgi:broad specificity phosphatase PhoE